MRAWVPLLAAAICGLACQPTVVCGPDTRARDGKCVPASLVRCGAGTLLSGQDCVPEDPHRCGAGTVASAGQCVAAPPLTCGPGTEASAGVCLTVDAMKRVTVPEAAEPNLPPGKAARFALPAVGAAPAVLGGIIDPPTAAGADDDGFVFTARRLQRVHFAALAVGSPSVGLILQPCKGTGTDPCEVDPTRHFSRFALTIDARGAARDVVIPFDGDWLVLVSDQSNLTQGLPYGAADFTYTVDVSQAAQPDPEPLVPSQAATGDYDALVGHALEVTADAPLYDVTLAPASDAAPFPGQRALWATGADGTLALSATDDTTYGTLLPMKPARVVFPPGRAQLFVDFVYELAAAQPYTLTAARVDTVPMGSLARQPFEIRGSLAGDGLDVYTVDVPGNALVGLEMVPRSGTQITPRLELRDARYQLLATADAFRLTRFFAAAEAGRYFVVASDTTYADAKVSLSYTMKASVSPVTAVGPVTVGPPQVASGTVGADGSAWFAVYAASDEDLAASVHPAADLDVTLSAFPSLASAPLAVVNAGAAGADERLAPRLVGSGSLLLVKVAGAAGGTFALTATATETTAVFETEPDDDAAHAVAVTLDAAGHGLAAGTLKSLDDRDFYAFTLAAAATVTLETHVGAQGGAANTQLWLLSSTGTYMSFNDDFNGTRFSQVTQALGPGRYTARVEPSWSARASDATDYVLTIDAR